MESSAVFGVGCAGQAADDATDREALEQQRRKLEHFATRAGSGHSAGPRDHTDVTPHTLAPEDYSQALSCEPGLYTIGLADVKELHTGTEGMEARGASPGQAGIPLGDSSPAAAGADDTFDILVGNPSVHQNKGQVRICRATAGGALARDRSIQVCILAVPPFMTIPDLCRFLGRHIDHVRHLRLVHEDSRARYAALLTMHCQDSADALYREFNGKPYSSMDTERCIVLFVKEILNLNDAGWGGGSGAAAGKGKAALHGPPLSFAGEGHTELPSCPVCLERLDVGVTGIMTTVCNHSFHCRCLSDWPDSSCPVCRYTQMPEAQQTGRCMHCGEPEDLWMCLICGFMGCGRYRGEHALQHFHDSGHSFSIELMTQRVWDYLGDNYVHRLVQNRMDGKLVELPEGGAGGAMNKTKEQAEGDAKLEEALIGSKLESVLQEYNDMLTRTLDDQRKFFEDRISSLQQQWDAERQSLKEALRDKERELEEADLKAKERKHNDKKVAMLSDRLKKAWEEAEFHKQCNASLTANDEAMKAKLAAAASKDREIQDLQEQVRDLMFFLEAQKSVEASEHGPDIKEGQIVMQASPAARRRSKGSGGKSPHGAAGAT